MDIEGRKKKEIENREDVSFLVRTFYGRVRQDEHLGPIFNTVVKDWEEHLEKLTDFWESILFFVRCYSGNPRTAHISVDRQWNYNVESRHFGVWLNLWYGTLDDYFEGEIAERAKNNARKMSTNLFLNLYMARPDAEKTGS